MSRIGDRLRKAIPTARGEQKAIAHLAGVSPETLNKILTGATKEPGFETVAKIARAAGLDLNDLFGDEELSPIRSVAPDFLSATDRRRVADFVAWATGRFLNEGVGKSLVRDTPFVEAQSSSLAEVMHFPTYADAQGDFPLPPIAPDDFMSKDTDYPRPLHAWVVPITAEAAAGTPRNPDDILIPTTQLLNTLREVRAERTHVIKIIGHSMHPTLRHGWKVLIDPARSLFQPGKIVMVYLRDEGSTIGLLAKNAAGFKIVKRNPDYGGPVEIELRDGEWYPVGTVTTIVEAPVEIE